MSTPKTKKNHLPLLQRKLFGSEQVPEAAAQARGDSSEPSEQSEILSQTELHKMQRELSHLYLKGKNKDIKVSNEFQIVYFLSFHKFQNILLMRAKNGASLDVIN